MSLFLGLDAGGTKTIALLADQKGTIHGFGLAGNGNFQGGLETAKTEVEHAIKTALAMANASPERIGAAYYGMAGADRPQDFGYIRSFLEPLNPAQRWAMENDATIALKAGTLDGIGVVLICGTGTNAIGFNRRGEKVQVGGMGFLFGDLAGANEIAALGIRAATRAYDGRGEPTLLLDLFLEKLSLATIYDLVEYLYPDAPQRIRISSLAPIVFEAANRGDKVARQILRLVGGELALSGNTVIRRLGLENESVIKVILSGGVFQRAQDRVLIPTLVRRMRKAYPQVEVIKLKDDPVLGALYSAYELAGIPLTPELVAAVKESWAQVKKVHLPGFGVTTEDEMA